MSGDQRSWVKLTQSFATGTTFHGVRYVAEDTPYRSRRFAWLALILCVTCAFTALIVVRLRVFYKHPVLVNLDTDYMSSLPLPVVTVCNQNRYSKTKLQKNGLYDVIFDTYHNRWKKKQFNGNEAKAVKNDKASCRDRYILQPPLCAVIEDDNLWLIGKFSDTTSAVCQELCASAKDELCTGFLYRTTDRNCRLLRNDLQAELDAMFCLEVDRNTLFFRRLRCVDNQDIWHDFETEDNELAADDFYGDRWLRVPAKDMIDMGNTDHTFNSEMGYVLYLVKTYEGRAFKASVHTHFINTTGQCLKLFYQFAGNASLVVRATPGLFSRRWHNDARAPPGWQEANVYLPDGIRRIEIIADPGDLGDNNGIAIDDVKTWPCMKARECRDSHFYCKSGWCIPQELVCDGHADCNDGSDERANCDCPSYAFHCQSGRCIPRDLLCNGVDDCGDGSDETEPCVDEMSVQCDFSMSFACRYHEVLSSQSEEFGPPITMARKSSWIRDEDDKHNPQYNTLAASLEHLECSAKAFRCHTSGNCISRSLLCDGKDDCGDNTDETALCGCRSDLLLMVHTSVDICGQGQLNCTKWQQIKEFMINVALSMNIIAGSARIAVMTYGQTINLKWGLNSGVTTAESIKSRIESIFLEPPVVMRNSPPALIHALNEVFTLRGGDRQNADNTIVLLTNHGMNDMSEQVFLSQQAADVREADVRIIAVGMSDRVPEQFLSALSSPPHERNRNYFTTLDVDRVGQLLDRLVTSACLKPTTPPTIDSDFMYSMKLVRRQGDGFPGDITTLRSSPQNVSHGVKLAYSIALSRSARDPLAAIDVFVLQRSTGVQSAETARAVHVGRWQQSALSADMTACVAGGSYWLEFRATTGWQGAVYAVNRVHGGNDWARPCLPDNTMLMKFEQVSCTFDRDNICGYTTRSESEFASWERIVASSFELAMEQIGVCNATLYAESGRIVSPYILGELDADTTCTWNIHAPPGGVITIHFDYIDEDSLDLLEVQLGSQRMLPVGRETFVTTQGSAIVKFTANRRKIFSARFNITVDSHVDYALASSYRGVIANKAFSNRLISPTQNIIGVAHCLSLRLVLEGELIVTVISGNVSTVMFYGALTLGRVWHLLMLNIGEVSQPEQTTIQVVIDSLLRGERITYGTFIKDVELDGGTCSEIYAEAGNANCTFNDIEQCGYTDMSDPGPSRWIRSYDPEKSEYSMLAHFATLSTLSLLSPEIHFNGNACVVLKTRSNMVAKSILVYIFAKGAEYTEDAYMRGDDTVYVDLQVARGNRMVIQLASMNFGDWLKIDDARLYHATCEQMGLPPDVPHRIAPGRPPMPPLMKYYVGVETRLVQEYAPPDSEERANEYLIDNLQKLDVPLQVFYERYSPPVQDFVLKCTLDGAPCPDDFMRTVMTDMGQCITFNANLSNIFRVTSTGPSHGLSLLLNSQTYEQIHGIHIDSGLKVYWHDESEIAAMNEQSRALAPGQHTSVSLEYIESRFLGSPYGNCGTETLHLYEDDKKEYRFSKCQREIATADMVTSCGCRDAYMPGPSKVCNTNDYLHCVILDKGNDKIISNDSFNSTSPANCPSDCHSTQYDARLSYAPLSETVVAKLSTSQIDRLRAAYLASLNEKHRINDDLMSTHVKHFSDMESTLYQLELLINFNTESTFVCIVHGMQSIIDMVHDDIKAMFSDNAHEMGELPERIASILQNAQGGYFYAEVNGYSRENMREAFNRTRQSSLLSASLRARHSHDDIDVVTLQRMLADSGHMTSVSDSLREIRTEVEHELIEPLERRLIDTLTEVIADYTEAFKFISDMRMDTTDISTLARVTQLAVWRRPFPVGHSKTLQFISTRSEYWPSYDLLDFTRETAAHKAGTILTDYFNELTTAIHELANDLVKSTNRVSLLLERYREFFKKNIDHVDIDYNFVSTNIIQMDMFYGELKYTEIEQQAAYTITNFFSDLGGYMGLLLGASIMTMFEFLDFFFYNLALHRSKKQSEKTPDSHEMQNKQSA